MTTEKTKPRAAITMETIASMAGTSRAAVSAVMNPRRGGTIRVSPDTRQRIESIIERMEYRPNPIGRALASGRSSLIGMLVESVEASFLPKLIEAVEDGAENHQYGVLVMTTRGNIARQTRSLKLMLEKQVEGVILGGLYGEKFDRLILQQLRSRRVALVFLAYSPADSMKGAGSVRVDGGLIGEMAIGHLMELGHRRIACVGASDWMRQGIQRASGPGAAIDNWSFDSHAERPMAEVLDRWSKMEGSVRPTALFINGDEHAISLLNLAVRSGVRVPQELSVVGVDDLPQAAEALVPLTTVRQPKYHQGLAASELLFDMINGAEPRHILLKPEMVIRESTRRLS